MAWENDPIWLFFVSNGLKAPNANYIIYWIILVVSSNFSDWTILDMLNEHGFWPAESLCGDEDGRWNILFQKHEGRHILRYMFVQFCPCTYNIYIYMHIRLNLEMVETCIIRRATWVGWVSNRRFASAVTACVTFRSTWPSPVKNWEAAKLQLLGDPAD